MSNEAHEDIDSIFEYISRDSIKYANELQKIFILEYMNQKMLLIQADMFQNFWTSILENLFIKVFEQSMMFLKIQILFTYILSFMAKEILNHFINLTLKIIFNSNYY